MTYKLVVPVLSATTALDACAKSQQERDAAAADRRAGGESISGSTDSWNDVKTAFQYWGAPNPC